MSTPDRVVLLIKHVMSWRRSLWAESAPSRQAWLVTCPEHPQLGKDSEGEPWGYATRGTARSVAAKHGNAFHQWPQHDQIYDVLELEEAQP